MDTGWPELIIPSTTYRHVRRDFALSWYDRAADIPEPQTPEGEDGEGNAAPTASGKRVKFTCPSCRANAWGKATLELVCQPCKKPLRRAA